MCICRNDNWADLAKKRKQTNNRLKWSNSYRKSMMKFLDEKAHCQFARVVKGVDLRSTAGNCAWARTPQLTVLLRAHVAEAKNNVRSAIMTLAGLEPAIFGSEDQRLIH